jgi:hypothetical protein
MMRAMSSEAEAYDELRCYTLGLQDAQFVHQHVVDAWTAQHADRDTRPIALTFALVGLYLLAERGLSGREVQRVHTQLARRRENWPVFPLPAARGSITVVEVLETAPGAARAAAIHAWCASVWAAYAASHAAVAQLLERCGYGAAGA